MVQGATSGVLGGLFAAFLPVVTGGIGGFVAGHATAQRDDRAFLVAQGAAKIVYYVGGLLLFFVPGLHLTRGGMAWMVSTRYTPTRRRNTMQRRRRSGCRRAGLPDVAVDRASGGCRGVAHTLPHPELCHTGDPDAGCRWRDGAICAVATGIGLIPVFWGARRMSAMGGAIAAYRAQHVRHGSRSRWIPRTPELASSDRLVFRRVRVTKGRCAKRWQRA